MIRQFCRCIPWQRFVSGKPSQILNRSNHAHPQISTAYSIILTRYFGVQEKVFSENEQVDPDIYNQPKIKNYTIGRNVPDLIAIRKNPHYHDLFFHYDPQQVENELGHPEVKRFIATARSADAPAFHPKYRDELDKVFSCLQELTELEFQYVLYHLRLFLRPKDADERKEYEKVWKPLDEECIRRGVARKKWRSPVTFVYANLWDFLMLGRQSAFHWICIKICIRKVDTLSRQKFVRLCQSITKSKKLPKDIKLYNMQYNVARIIEDTERNGGPITPEELSSICCVFYKMKYPFHDRESVAKILDVVIKHANTISNSSLTGICNGISISTRLQVSDKISELMDSMVDQVSRLDMNSCASLLILASRNRVRNTKILAAVADRLEILKNRAEEMEIHYIEWLATAYEDLDRPSSPAFQTILSLMKNYTVASKQFGMHLRSDESDSEEESENSDGTKEKGKHEESGTVPRSGLTNIEDMDELIANLFQKRLVRILHSLAYGGIYPRNLIAKALSTEFLNATYGKRMHTYTPELLRLDLDVAEDLPDYNGERLSKKATGFLTKTIMRWIPPSTKLKVNGYDIMCRNVLEISNNILGGSNRVVLSNVVPHYGTIEAVFCTTKSGEPVQVPESFKLKNEYEPKILLPEDCPNELQYHAIIMYYWEMLIDSTDEPLGRYSKMREKVGKMGYKTYEISHNLWRMVPPGEMDNYIRSKLQDVVNIMPVTDFRESVPLTQK